MNIGTHAKRVADILGDAAVHGMFSKLVQIEVGRCLRKKERLKEELALYEKRFGMDSQRAWVEYQKGKLSDDGDIMEWMMLFENFRALVRQNDRLSQIDTLQ